MNDKLYCYPGSDVLKNKFGIRDGQLLKEAERKLTMLRAMELLDHPLGGVFDFDHLCRIHAYLFQDLYEWAGESRKVDIAKGNMFCRAEFIKDESLRIFTELAGDIPLKGLARKEAASKLAYYFSEINALHPFREGNGRTQREFIRELAFSGGYVVRFSRISRDMMLQASRDSFLRDYESMERLFEICIR